MDEKLTTKSSALRKLQPRKDSTTADALVHNRLRVMRRDDIPAVTALFKTAFAKGRPIGDLASYIETVFFDCPHYSEGQGGLVYENGDGGISTALLSLPMPFTVHGKPVLARLLCAFMSDGTKSGTIGATRIARSLSGGRIEFCFSDNASPVSTAHCLASGGITLPIQSLQWRRAFQPLGSLLASISCVRRLGLLPRVAAPILRVVDRALLAWKPSLTPRPAQGCTTKTVPVQAFCDHAEKMTQRFAVRPVWTREYFDWLVQVIAMNRTLGPLQCRVVEKGGKTIGVYLLVGHKNATANVLNLICENGRELDVTKQMFADLARENYVDAIGMNQPFMMNAILRQRQLTFQHRGNFCVQSTDSNLIDAAKMGDLYAGGLASESWSRLVTDF